MRATACALALGLLAATAWARTDTRTVLEEARRALKELRFEDALAELDTALRRGGHTRADLLALLALHAEVDSVASGPAASEAEYRRLLVIAPNHPPPARDTPIFTVPFARARRWVESRGALEVQHRLTRAPAPNQATPLLVTVSSDPLAMVDGARLYHRLRTGEPFALVAGNTLRPSLPPAPAGSTVEYYLEVLDERDDVVATPPSDERDDVVAEIGTAADPFVVELPQGQAVRAAPLSILPATPDPSRSNGLRTSRWVVGAVGLAAIGAAIGADAAGHDDFNQLKRDCAPDCSTNPRYSRYQQERTAAIALYSVGAVVVTTSVVLFIAEAVTRRRR
jgi:hypothetical protein